MRTASTTRYGFATALVAASVFFSPPVEGQSLERAPAQPPLVLRGVNIVDGMSAEPRMGVSVVVVDGLIQRIGPLDVAAPAGAREMDLTGLGRTRTGGRP